MTLLTGKSFAALDRSIRYLPDANDMTVKAAQSCMVRFPNMQHVLLCDTAFFATLPPEASAYAVPYELRKEGVRKYGGYGLCHQWAREWACAYSNTPLRRVVSVFLGDRTNAAAIKNGAPVETSMGFTAVEGIISSTACGDIDPTILFQLHSTGLSFAEIDDLLSRKSGFTGLVGESCRYLDLMHCAPKSDKAAAREVLRYSVIKHIGASLALLGGADAIVFTTPYLKDSLRFIKDICGALDFLGANCTPPADKDAAVVDMTGEDSQIRLLCLKYSKWEIMAALARTFIKQGVRKHARRKTSHG